ncbi:zinc dependent phospholipase C family protein [Collinsella tanakaei]|uniref:zinc dependent phospholipase C family protein n=1 Tax=Collinsella tanakaei TaxID=626935 RepID=UPI001956CA9A|nr:zinc dependent phospholipase C family protein [Collinsella tanakaei]MBM6868626.1 zinc dependent phospholipase C family protein [Collinsella tanakaei]
MPALITHHLFGEESIERLPAGIVSSEEERIAFLIANQGPDPFFFRVRTPHARECMTFAQRMHAARISRQFSALREGVSSLPAHDVGVGRAFALGMLSHYALDRCAHPFVYDQQWGIQRMDESLAGAGSKVHAVIESDLDVLMLQMKRAGATCADCPPVSELVTTGRVNKVAGALTSFVARSVYNLEVGAAEYGGAVADMQFVYRLIEPAGSLSVRVLGALEGLVSNYSILTSLSHPVCDEAPAATGNLRHLPWSNPYTHEESHESFPEVFARALDDYARLAEGFIRGENMAALTRHTNYSGRVLGSDEEYNGEE